MNQRDRVARLAATDFAQALRLASSIKNTRERIQALGWVARHAPPHQIRRIIALCAKAAHTPSDPYQVVMALAWPLRALHETGHHLLMRQLLRVALELVPDVRPTSSRAEAIGLLIHAVLPAGIAVAEPAIDMLTSQCRNDQHWRVVRSLGDLALLVNRLDRKRATRIAEAIPLTRKRQSTLAKLLDGKSSEPRQFFW